MRCPCCRDRNAHNVMNRRALRTAISDQCYTAEVCDECLGCEPDCCYRYYGSKERTDTIIRLMEQGGLNAVMEYLLNEARTPDVLQGETAVGEVGREEERGGGSPCR